MKIKSISLILMMFFLVTGVNTGCKKAVVDASKELLLDIMTNGRWVIEVYSQDNMDLTAEYTGYEFQFYRDGKLEGIKGSEVMSGTWVPDTRNLTMQSNFPTGSNTLLIRLNETWKITKSSMSHVEAKPLSNTKTAYLKLIKK
jgi:hypothetical protein